MNRREMLLRDKRFVIWPLWSLFAWVVSAIIGLLHHLLIYPLYFHGDAAAKSIYADALLDENSIFPVDFSYSTGFFLLDQGIFISAFKLGGVDGYPAFALGSAVSLAFWGMVLFLALSAHLKDRLRALLFTVLLLIPLGWWETDFVMGQQSHTISAILGIIFVLILGEYFKEGAHRWLFAMATIFALLALSAPARVILLAVAVFIAALLFAPVKKVFFSLAASGVGFLIGYAGYRILADRRFIAGADIVEGLSTSEEVLASFVRSWAEAFSGVSNLHALGGQELTLAILMLYGLTLVVIFTYVGFLAHFSRILVRRVRSRLGKLTGPSDFREANFVDFIGVVAVTGIWTGLLAVAALNPDSSRHFLWAVFMLKFAALRVLFDALTMRPSLGRLGAPLILLGVVLASSTWLAQSVVHGANIFNAIDQRARSAEVVAVASAVQQTGIPYIYGDDFWRMMPLNSYVPGARAQPLLDPGAIRTRVWLTRPSWSCVEGNVLYLVKDTPMDVAVESLLKDAPMAQLLEDGGGFRIWIGPPVWAVPGEVSCSP